MKYLYSLTFIVLLLGCKSDKKKQDDVVNTETSVTKEDKDSIKQTAPIDPEVALRFFNSYIDNINKMDDAIGILEWAKSNPLATENFKKRLEKMHNEALKYNPEGLTYDPLLNAQDYPDQGVELHHFDKNSGYVTLKGIGWELYKVRLKLVNLNGKTLVDGCGTVNIPQQN